MTIYYVYYENTRKMLTAWEIKEFIAELEVKGIKYEIEEEFDEPELLYD